MKKIVIGTVLLVSGLYTTLSLVYCAVSVLPDLTAWSNDYLSKLWFLIFAGQSQFSDGADGLGLGLFFIFGIVIAALGLAILIREYFIKEGK